MAEQIILNTDLYDNLLTERKGDYTAKPRITGTLYNKIGRASCRERV